MRQALSLESRLPFVKQVAGLLGLCHSRFLHCLSRLMPLSTTSVLSLTSVMRTAVREYVTARYDILASGLLFGFSSSQLVVLSRVCLDFGERASGCQLTTLFVLLNGRALYATIESRLFKRLAVVLPSFLFHHYPAFFEVYQVRSLLFSSANTFPASWYSSLGSYLQLSQLTLLPWSDWLSQAVRGVLLNLVIFYPREFLVFLPLNKYLDLLSSSLSGFESFSDKVTILAWLSSCFSYVSYFANQRRDLASVELLKFMSREDPNFRIQYVLGPVIYRLLVPVFGQTYFDRILTHYLCSARLTFSWDTLASLVKTILGHFAYLNLMVFFGILVSALSELNGTPGLQNLVHKEGFLWASVSVYLITCLVHLWGTFRYYLLCLTLDLLSDLCSVCTVIFKPALL